jgi:hypothetical protein
VAAVLLQQSSVFDSHGYRCACLQLQQVEQDGRHGQHDGTADFAQIGGVHG